MKRLAIIMLLLASLFTQVNAQTNADTLLGKWTSEDKTRVIEFVKNGDSYNAIIIEAADKNIVGKTQLADLVYGNGIYKGKVYLPKKGKSYSCTVKINNSGTLDLIAKAGFMSKSQTWTRVQ